MFCVCVCESARVVWGVCLCFFPWEISGQKLAALMQSCYLVMDMLTDLFLVVFQQQPPTWMHQRPPLSVDVNVGKSCHISKLFSDCCL
jgi:hypothetical protein